MCREADLRCAVLRKQRVRCVCMCVSVVVLQFPLHAAAQLCPNPDTWDVEPTWLAPCQGSQTEALQVDEAPPCPEETGHQGGGGVTGSPGVQHERPSKPAGTYRARRRIAAQRRAKANAHPPSMAKAIRNAARAQHRVQTAEASLGVAPPGAGVSVCRMVRLLEQGACPEDLAEAVAQLVLAHVQHKQAQETLAQVEQMQWGVKCIMHPGSKGGGYWQPRTQRDPDGGLMAADPAVQLQQQQLEAVAQLAAVDGALRRKGQEERAEPKDSTDGKLTAAAGAQATPGAGVAARADVGESCSCRGVQACSGSIRVE